MAAVRREVRRIRREPHPAFAAVDPLQAVLEILGQVLIGILS